MSTHVSGVAEMVPVFPQSEPVSKQISQINQDGRLQVSHEDINLDRLVTVCSVREQATNGWRAQGFTLVGYQGEPVRLADWPESPFGLASGYVASLADYLACARCSPEILPAEGSFDLLATKTEDLKRILRVVANGGVHKLILASACEWVDQTDSQGALVVSKVVTPASAA